MENLQQMDTFLKEFLGEEFGKLAVRADGFTKLGHFFFSGNNFNLSYVKFLISDSFFQRERSLAN